MTSRFLSPLNAVGGPRTSHPDLLFSNFNQDNTCISTGHRKGYTITNCDPFGKVYARNDGATSIVEMLFCTSLVALVGTGDKPNSSTRRLQIVNTKRQSTICELTFPTSILAVKMNRKRLVVVLEEQIYVYDISNMKLLHTIETSPNPGAICTLSPSSENSYLAYPSPLPTPSPLSSPSSSSFFPNWRSHKSPISALRISPSGLLLATSSDKGTVIRVFGIPNGEKVAQFRRGSYPARIYDLSFNAVGTLLAVTSDTETVHIFKIGGQKGGNKRGSWTARKKNRDDEDGEEWRSGSEGSGGGYEAFIEGKKNEGMSGSLRRKSLNLGRNLAGSVGGYLPNTLTEIWEPQRDFAFLKLPSSGVRSVVAISNTTPQIMVVTSEGVFYSFNIDLENGGECVLQKSYSLMEGLDDADGNGIGS
ncbi:putative phosphoinositide binding protein [Atractiella rhizophila]|nr:putative phosphoinositide binding protein [Atractiella rhizophila]